MLLAVYCLGVGLLLALLTISDVGEATGEDPTDPARIAASFVVSLAWPVVVGAILIQLVLDWMEDRAPRERGD